MQSCSCEFVQHTIYILIIFSYLKRNTKLLKKQQQQMTCLQGYLRDQLTYTAPEVENLKRSFPSGYTYETHACEVGAPPPKRSFTVAPGIFLGSSCALEDNKSTRNTHGKGR